MRIRRRALLGATLGATAFGVAGCGLAFRRSAPRVERDLTIAAAAIPSFLRTEPERVQFGRLRYRRGLSLTSDDAGFGGFSALWRSADGRELVSVSDNAQWLTAQAVEDGSGIAGLAAARMAPLLDEAGRPLVDGRSFDTESLAMVGGEAFVGIERVHEVRRFAFGRDGVSARGERIPTPPDMKRLPGNAGLEALGVAPPGHALAGSLVGISEQARRTQNAPTKGWVLTGPRQFGFDVVRTGNYDVTDLGFLPSGEALLLERRFDIFWGIACRIRLLAPDVFRPGALVDGPVIFEADRSHEIDNMEGIAIHRDGSTGETVVTLVSDDNFMPFQRTLILEFVLS